MALGMRPDGRPRLNNRKCWPARDTRMSATPWKLGGKALLSGSLPKRSYLYAVKPSSDAPLLTGQFEAIDIETVRIGLAKLLGCRDLPEKTIIMDKADVDQEGAEAWQFVRVMLSKGVPRPEDRKGALRSFRDLRKSIHLSDSVESPRPNWSQILRILTRHNEWLRNPNSGERAHLAGMILTGINLSGRELSQAHLANADLSGADLRGTIMTDVNLAGANLRGANLRGANLENSDLSEADLRGAVLLGANLKGVDLWRANIKGMVIGARNLHQAFECRSK